MGFPFTPRSMTLDDFELLQVTAVTGHPRSSILVSMDYGSLGRSNSIGISRHFSYFGCNNS